jgi:cathepsin B
MFKFVIAGTVAAFAAAKKHPIRSELVNELKGKVSWEVHEPETNPLRNMSREELLNLVGTNVEVESSIPATNGELPVGGLPTNFDPRDGSKWNKECIHPIRDQQQCGSCWAFGATEALSDRFCIAGKDVILAPQDPVSCDSWNFGCNGGYLSFVWSYLTSTGAVTEDCWPYSSGTGDSGTCRKTCTGSGQSWIKYKCKSSSTVHPTTVDAIKAELYANGPMEGGFTVYEDFMSYKSGVYYHVSGDQLGGHAIKVIGWGHDDASGLDYWLCANSWSASWGDNGFFKIKIGDSGINGQLYGCAPQVASEEFM